MENHKKIKISIAIVLATIFGFLVGKIDFRTKKVEIIERRIQPEISLVQLKKISGDVLEVELSGPVRILWAEENSVEDDGTHEILLGQIPNENDLRFYEFPYTGNAKTGKFYPSTTYFARGVEVKHRRFFRTKQEAIDAGFIPSKSVK